MAEFDEYGDPVAAPSGGGNFLTKKLGPLPMYVWVILGIIVAYYVYKKGLFGLGGSSSSDTSAGSTDSTTPEIVDNTGNPVVPDTTANPSQLSNLRKRITNLNAEVVKLKRQNAADDKRDRKEESEIKKLQKELARGNRRPSIAVKPGDHRKNQQKHLHIH